MKYFVLSLFVLTASCKQFGSNVSTISSNKDCTELEGRLNTANDRLNQAIANVKAHQAKALEELKTGKIPTGEEARAAEQETQSIYHQVEVAEEAYNQTKSLLEKCRGTIANVPPPPTEEKKSIATATEPIKTTPTKAPETKPKASSKWVAGRDYVPCDYHGRPGYVYVAANGQRLCYPLPQ